MRTYQIDRISRVDIFNHLDRLLGVDARNVAEQVVALRKQGEIDRSLTVLKSFDAQIGGIGLHEMRGRKLPGVFRAISYVDMSLRSPNAVDFGRQIIQFSCEHIESILKRMTRKGIFNFVRVDKIPMGALLRKVKPSLPQSLYDDLLWIATVYNSAKHEHDFSDMESEPEHFFELDEAIAVYFIARSLAHQLITFGKKTRAELAIEE